MTKLRPKFHFTPKRNWMNDPNGLVFVDGWYHMFFQYNPFGCTWGSMSWGHAISRDLLNWEEQPIAIQCDETQQIFSGSVVVDPSNLSGLKISDSAPLIAIFTSLLNDGEQAQSLAVSQDNGFKWDKFPGNPVLSQGWVAFRDPKVFYYQRQNFSRWVMAVAKSDTEEVLFYSSENLTNWELESSLRIKCPNKGVLECPDLFQLSTPEGQERWVILLSFNNELTDGTQCGSSSWYLTGQFDGHKFIADQPIQRLDWGQDFYAATTFNNVPNHKRIMIGWMSNWLYAKDVPDQGWRGAMSIPRELSLQLMNGVFKLCQNPVLTSNQRCKIVPLCNGKLESSKQLNIGSSSSFIYRIVWRADDANELNIELFASGQYSTLLSYKVSSQKLRIDRSRSGDVSFHKEFASACECYVPLTNGRLQLTILGDSGLIEVFTANGDIALSVQTFPPVNKYTHRIFSSGCSAVSVSTAALRETFRKLDT